MTGSPADRARKRERVRALLERRGADSLLLSSHEAVSWYLEGPRTHVSLAGPPVLAVRVDREGDTVYAPLNEADRLAEEELLPKDAAALVRVPWTMAPATAADGTSLAEADVLPELRAARASLLPAERTRYGDLARECAEVLTDVLAAATPSSTERALAAAAAAGLAARGIDPLVTLASGAERIGHRHPLPTAAPVGERAMLVVCGRRHGLIANATRWVGTERALAETASAEVRIREVEAAFLDATRPGTTLDAAFAAGIAGYAAAGFDPDEWRRHHQGGAAGYAGRDPRATPDTVDHVQENQAFAWNPSAPGVKIEDTVLISSTEVVPLTRDARWPSVEHAGRARPRPAVFGELA